jgi:hypothetical protein
MLRVAEPKKDQRQREKVSTFYGIPAGVHEAVKKLASAHGVPAGEVVRLFFERGLADLAAGKMAMSGALRAGKYTLFPAETEASSLVVGKPSARKRKQENGKVSYRGLPETLVQAMSETAAQRHLAVGEVARALLEWGLAEVEAGRLELTVYGVETRFSLYG